MPSMEKFAKKAAPHLEPGEVVQAACACQQKGANNGAAFGLLGALIANRAGKKKREAAAESGFPMAQYMLVLATDRRVVVMTGKKLVGTVGPAQLTGAELVKEKGVTFLPIKVRMANGHEVEINANKRTDPVALVAAINRLAGAPG